MSWFLFAIIAYFLYALVSTIDKFLLRQPATTKPVVFSFYIGILSIFTFVLAPLGLSWPGVGKFLFAVLAGLVFFIYLSLFFRALDLNETSRVIPIIGGVTPILVLFFSYLFLSEGLGIRQFVAFALLVFGGILISLKKKEGTISEGVKGVKYIIAALLFGSSYLVLAKFVFFQQNFISGFLWSRLGIVLGAILLLLWRPWRREIFSGARHATKGLSALLVSNKLIAGFGSLFLHLAISRGNVSLINAMQGTEYAFLFILALILSKKFPQILRERLSAGIIAQKIIAICLIGVGLAILAV